MGEAVCISLPRETILKIQMLKSKGEKVEDFIEKLVEEQFMMKEINLLQAEKMEELWNNEKDAVWDSLE